MFNARNLIVRLRQLLQDDSLDLESEVKPSGLGAHHKRFSVTLRDRSKYHIRVQNPCSGDSDRCGQIPHHNLISEYATVEYVRQHTRIPVPVLAYESGSLGAVGAEWLIEQPSPGIPMNKAWPGMSTAQRGQLVMSISDIWADVLKLRFRQIGSLYPTDRSGYLTDKHDAAYVGPFGMRARPALRCGPFDTTQDWLVALARRYLDCAGYRRWTCEELDQIDAVVERITDSPVLQSNEGFSDLCFAMEHMDLHPHNIRVDPVDPTKVTAVLGWDCARIVPLFAVQLQFPKHLEFNDPEEKDALSWIMFNRVALQVPEIEPTKTCREIRKLYRLAEESYRFHDIGHNLDFVE